MSVIYGEIITNETTESIINKLKKLTIEEQPFIKPKGVYFLGKVSGTTFNLITFNAPPTNIQFTVSDATVKLKYEKQSMMPTLTAGIYALGFPIALALFLWGIIDRDVPWEGKLFLTGFLIFPFLLNKIFKYIYNSYVLPNDNDFFRKLEQLLDVKITKSQEF